MAKYQLQVNISCGQLVIAFDSEAELEERLKELNPQSVEKAIATHFKTLVHAEARRVKPALEGICAFRRDGTLEFLKPAGSKVEAIGLILYAYEPDPVDLKTIGTLAAEKNPAAYLGQKQYAKLFQKIGTGLYGLSQDGKTWVASTVIPKLKKE